MIFISLEKLVRTILWILGAGILYLFYQSIGPHLFFLLIVSLLVLRFAPVLLLPVLLFGGGIHVTGGASFITNLFLTLFVFVPFGYMIVLRVYSMIEKKDESILK
ncbi:TPA: hypothetical protein ACT2IF_000217 [Streptococcus suis]